MITVHRSTVVIGLFLAIVLILLAEVAEAVPMLFC